VRAAETAPPPKPAASTETGSKDKPPLIIHNPDGTFTVQKAPESGKSKGGKQKGLVIAPQVVVATAGVPTKEKEN
jgi:hypothetical protein